MQCIRPYTGNESWRKRVPDFGDAAVKLWVRNAVQTNGTVNRLALDDLRERTRSRNARTSVSMHVGSDEEC